MTMFEISLLVYLAIGFVLSIVTFNFREKFLSNGEKVVMLLFFPSALLLFGILLVAESTIGAIKFVKKNNISSSVQSFILWWNRREQ